MIILQSDAKRIITDYFRVWATESVSDRSASVNDGALFYAHLKSEKAQLLEFRHPSLDKLQVVQSWLSGAGLISD
jgi:hypothetical protein